MNLSKRSKQQKQSKTESFSSILPEDITTETLMISHEVETEEYLLEMIQGHIDSRTWKWPNSSKEPVICAICKRTIKRDGAVKH